jgi:hypothetical protein
MRSPRYTIVIANRRTGVLRRFTISLVPAVCLLVFLFSLPVLIGIGAAAKAKSDVADLYARAVELQLENTNFKQTTEALSGQIQTLQSAISELGARAALDPSLQAAMDKLPAVVKAQAMGGTAPGEKADVPLVPGFSSPENTFGLLRELLQSIEHRLRSVQSDVDKRVHGRSAPGSHHRRARLSSRARHLGRARQSGLCNG